jgi:CRP-like cAMP-binding protein
MLDAVETIKILQNQPNSGHVAAGQVIFEAGQVGTEMYGIIEGDVEMQVAGKVVETLQAGDVFGEGALVHLDHKRDSTAIAKTDCHLAMLDQHHFLFAIQSTPMFAVTVMRSYSDRLRRLKHLLQN